MLGEWLAAPHVREWWNHDPSVDALEGDFGDAVDGAEPGEDWIAEHDRIGRLAVRLDISRLVIVGTGRSVNAMHQGAIMEGSWGSESVMVPDADAALALLLSELVPGDVVLVKASNAAGLNAPVEALVVASAMSMTGVKTSGSNEVS